MTTIISLATAVGFAGLRTDHDHEPDNGEHTNERLHLGEWRARVW